MQIFIDSVPEVWCSCDSDYENCYQV